jgi:glycosyltransferase involved in cell wall biosynthesis
MKKNSIKLQREKNARLVSIITPTYNRRKFIPNLIKCIEAQTHKEFEWIILDDGDDKIGDLVKHLPYVNYQSLGKKISLGEKRNKACDLARGSFLIFFDDDDFHFPTRIQHSLEVLKANPEAFIVGSSKMFIYYKKMDALYTTKDFNSQHATAGTFCFRKALLNLTKFENKAERSEERYFLKDYTIKMAQLDFNQTIIINAHDSNTFDKSNLLGTKTIETTDKTLDDFNSAWFWELS